MPVDRRAAILEFIHQFFGQRGRCPTEREIADHLRIGKTTVHYHITFLIQSGDLESSGNARGYVLPEAVRNPQASA